MSFKRKAAYEKYASERRSIKERKRITFIIVAIIVIVIVIVGLVVFNGISSNQDTTKYSSMDDEMLPTVTYEYNGEQINKMYGNSKEMNLSYVRDTICVLSDTYDMNIQIQTYGQDIKDMTFKIYDLSENSLIQEADIINIETVDENTISATVPVDNIIEEGKEYVMEIHLSQNLSFDAYYYTRIMKETIPSLAEHFALVKTLHESTYDYETCNEAFSGYKKGTNTANDNLGFVNLDMSIDYISWGNLAPVETIPCVYNLVDIDNNLAFFRVDYQVSSTNSDGETEYFMASEYFRTRIDTTGTYLLDYERTANEIFDPESNTITNSTIDLGVSSTASAETFCSPDGTNIAFVVNKSLYLMNTKTKELRTLFNFVSDKLDPRQVYDQHDINIVSVSDNGDVKFLVYGYMNRGLHKGESGIGLYNYSREDEQVTEQAFISSDVPFAVLEKSVGDLCYMNTSGYLYILLDGKIYSVNPETNEAECIAEGLKEGTYKVSPDHKLIAWQEGGLENDAEKINVLNMEEEKECSKEAGEGKAVKVIGFLDDDIVYGEGTIGNLYESNEKEYLLMDKIYTIDINAALQDEKGEDGYYFIEGQQEQNRVVITRVRSSKSKYVATDPFTIFATDQEEYPETKLEADSEELNERVYVLTLPTSCSSADTLVIESKTDTTFSSREIAGISSMVDSNNKFLVYAKGKLVSLESSPATAIEKAYDLTGCVVNLDGTYLYRRTTRVNSVEIPENSVNEAIDAYNNGKCINISGITLTEAMMLTAAKTPLVWEYNGTAYVISGYDSYDDLILTNISTKEQTIFDQTILAEGEFENSKLYVYLED